MTSTVGTKVASGKSTSKKGLSPGALSPSHGSDIDDDHLVSQ